jgi:hypothetical protein
MRRVDERLRQARGAAALDTAFSVDYQDVFARSWDLVEASYLSLAEHHENCRPVLELVREMRRRGYDHLFRAGHSLYSLVLSRSAEHGLRREQPFVEILVWPWAPDGAMRVSCRPGEARASWKKASRSRQRSSVHWRTSPGHPSTNAERAAAARRRDAGLWL